MRFTSTLGAAALAASTVNGAFFTKEEYDSGAVHHSIMQRKLAFWQKEIESGAMNSSQWPAWSGKKTCSNGIVNALPGVANHQFKCKNVDLYSFINHADLGCPTGEGSGSWGWVDPASGREFVAHGCWEGTPMIEILKDGSMKQRAFLTSGFTPGYYSIWKEIRVYKNYMLIGSELANHGVQIFDMTKLLDITDEDGVVTFDGQTDVESRFLGENGSLPQGGMHNVHAHEELDYGVAMGARVRTAGCMGGLVFFDLKDPKNPKQIGCAPQDGYVHDVECLVYKGPDSRYEGHDICYGYNEDTLTIYDATVKSDIKLVSRTPYVGASYTHQGAVLDKNWQEFIVLDDETDEQRNFNSDNPALDGYPATYIFDIRDLEKPVNTGLYKGTVRTIDHNQYTHNGYVYQSNYGAGLRIYDASSIPENPTGGDVCETMFIDILPEDDDLPGGGQVEFTGTWSHFRFPSGFVYINTIERGGFVSKVNRFDRCKPNQCNADLCLRGMRANTIPGRLEESQAFCGEFTKTFVADVSVLPKYVVDSCTGNVISRASSACECLPTPSP
jgi:choice-of-anchor B domain-containing protein